MPTNTYVALDKVTVGTATPSITFTGINQGYTDLVVVFQTGMSSAGNEPYLRFNSDSGSNYSETMMYGNGTTAYSFRNSISTAIQLARDVGLPTALESMHIVNVQNYSNSTTFKTVLARADKGSATYSQAAAYAGLWRSTAAITSLTISAGAGNLVVGSTFSLYGIKSEGAAAKATGGYITSDANYFYHTFLASGTFAPTQSITADVLTIAAGGGGGRTGGGAGAGGLLFSNSQSLTATNYTVTVGAGGAGSNTDGVAGTTGGSSAFASLSATGGGGGGSFGGAGGSGGSGGGGAAIDSGSAQAGGSGTSGQGNAGGNGVVASGANRSAGGGGGAGAAGAAAVSGTSGVGGVGSTAYSSWGLATGTGQNVSGTYYYAGGGGGVGSSSTVASGGFGGGGAGSSTTGNNGTANTGGGAGGGVGGSGSGGGTGGSGIVIVRYAKV